MAGVYSSTGAFRMTVVDGTTFVGAYAPDGSLNVIEAPGNVPVGWRHPCGAMYITITTGTPRTTYWAPDGSLYVTFGLESTTNAVRGERADTVVGEDPGDVELDPEFSSINLELTPDKKGGKKVAESASWSSARASVAATGKVYFEAQATVLSGLQEAAFGLYNASFTLEGDEPGGANSAAYQSAGQTGDEGTFTAATAYSQGERVMFAYDSGTGKFWVGRLGTWSGDPEAGTGEAGTITGTVYPGISLKTTGGEIFLYLSANDWNYSAPTGWGSLANPGEAGASGPTDPNFANVVLLASFDGTDGATTATDGSNSAHPLTFNGTAQIDTAQSKFGGASLLTNGANTTYVSAPDSLDWKLAATNSDEYTIEMFVRLASVGSDAALIGQYTSTISDRAWRIFKTNTNYFQFAFYAQGSGTLQTVFGNGAGGTLTTDTWYHVAVDKDSTGKIRIYVNGVMVGSATPADSSIFDKALPLTIGADGTNFAWPGHIDELRITKGVARYASDAGFTVPTEAFPRA